MTLGPWQRVIGSVGSLRLEPPCSDLLTDHSMADGLTFFFLLASPYRPYRSSVLFNQHHRPLPLFPTARLLSPSIEPIYKLLGVSSFSLIPFRLLTSPYDACVH